MLYSISVQVCIYYKYIYLCIYVFSNFSHIQLFVTPWAVAHQAPLSMGFSRQEYWSEYPCPPPEDPPNPDIELLSPASPVLQADSLPTEPINKNIFVNKNTQSNMFAYH